MSSEIHFLAWPGEDSYINEDPEEWSPGFARYVYMEHVLDSIADYREDREARIYKRTGTEFYVPIPMTLTWRRVERGKEDAKFDREFDGRPNPWICECSDFDAEGESE